MEPRKGLSLDTQEHHRRLLQHQEGYLQSSSTDVNGVGGFTGIHHHHDLVVKRPIQQIEFNYHPPTPPIPHHPLKQDSFLRLQQQSHETHLQFHQLDSYLSQSRTQNPNTTLKKPSLNAQTISTTAKRRMVLGGGGAQGSRTSLRNAGAGEIVEVPGGGRIVRSTAGRKDRHSKVCTAKGPRDRRVRLAAHTAIQFYDVQDRLGYDRPSKAVDWLMKKAKSAIDALDEPPAWKPVSKSPEREATKAYEGSLLPPSMESDSIADTIKSFFPMGGGDADSEGQTLQFQSYQSSDLMAMRDSSQSQDLKLSLQSLQEPMMIQSHHNNNRHSNQEENQQQSHFPGTSQIGFDNPSGGGGGGWGDESQHQPRLIGWNFGGYGSGGSGGGGFMFIPPQTSLQQQHHQQQQQLLFSGHESGGQSSSHLFPQGGPLQSNYTSLVTNTTSSHDHHHDHTVLVHPMSLPGIGLSSSAGFSGFRIPARIQGDEDQDGNKPFSLSSGSRH